MEDLLKKHDEAVLEYNKIIVESFRKQDFRNYNEVLLSATSCAVEGNTFTVDEARELKKKGISLKLQNHSLLEAYEILDHFKAYEFLFNNLEQPITESLIKETQKMVTANTLEYAKGHLPGEYSNTQMGAGDTVFGDYITSIARMPSLATSGHFHIDCFFRWHFHGKNGK